MAVERPGSILSVDFGNVYTRAVLIDLVDGVYRLVARAITHTTSDFPIGDVNTGLKRALREISDVTGRRLLTPDDQIITPERANRSGVDYFLATASTGRTLRTVVIGLVPELSVASALRAAAGTYVEIIETLSLADGRSEEEQLNAILRSRPDLIFIAGGTEGGAREPVLRLARVAHLAMTLAPRGLKPMVVYAGNTDLEPQIRLMFNKLAPLFVAANVRPSLDTEELEDAQLQLALAFDERQSNRGGGYERVANLSALGVLPSAQSYNLIVDYLGRSSSGNVLALDIGSAVSTLSAHVDGQTATIIRADIGVGHSAEGVVHTVGTPAVERWLPFAVLPDHIRDYALNKTLRPATVPETLKELYFEHALLRASVEALLAVARPTWTRAADNLVSGPMPPISLALIAGSSLNGTGFPAFNALLALDALQLTGVTRLLGDPYGLIAALGGVARVNPGAVVQVLESGSLEPIGMCFSLSGRPAAGRTALNIRVTPEGGQPVEADVAGDHLWVYPLGIAQTARVDVRVVGRGLHIGGKRRLRMQVEGGSAGLIFDARGRPLPLAQDLRDRAAQLPGWIADVTGSPLQEIPAEWFTLPKADESDTLAAKPARGRRGRGAKAAAPAAERPRRGLFRRRAKPKDDDMDDRLSQLEDADDDQPDTEFTFEDDLNRLRR